MCGQTMANQDHVDVLKRGANVWNSWRGLNSVWKPDLTGAGLTGANLTAANLTGARLLATTFLSASLHQTDFSGSHWGPTVFADVNLSAAIGLESVNHNAPTNITTSTL